MLPRCREYARNVSKLFIRTNFGNVVHSVENYKTKKKIEIPIATKISFKIAKSSSSKTSNGQFCLDVERTGDVSKMLIVAN